jgi:hypothetical protein
MVHHMSRGAVQKRERIRAIEDIPGTVEPAYRDREITEVKIPRSVREAFLAQRIDPDEINLRIFDFAPCNVMTAREPAAVGGDPLWHLTISTPSRHPTWDEIKVARYRLLPLELTFAMLLPPPQFYVNLPEQDHVFQLWEVTDPRAPWTTG